MQCGVQMIFQSYGYGAGMSDAQVYDEEIHLGVLADQLGFDALWPVEHHFEDYAFCPDNTVFLAHMAGLTRRIKLATGAVILPWNTPLRVAERIAMLDHLAKDRLIFGMGRGLARREYEQFGIDMNESRARFDEAAPMILEALETGFIEGAGPFYAQPRAPIRPKPRASFKNRVSCVAMSPDSVKAAARLGAKMVIFSQKPWSEAKLAVDDYRADYRQLHRQEPPPILTCDFTYCDDDPSRAEELGRRYIAGYLTSVMHHYELAGEHLKNAKGYEAYGSAVDLMRAVGLEAMCDMYLEVQAWGTPEQILAKLEARRKIIGDHDLTLCFRFAGMPLEAAERSMRLFAAKVMPALQDSGHLACSA